MESPELLEERLRELEYALELEKANLAQFKRRTRDFRALLLGLFGIVFLWFGIPEDFKKEFLKSTGNELAKQVATQGLPILFSVGAGLELRKKYAKPEESDLEKLFNKN